MRRFHFLRLVGRLKPGVTIAQAQRHMDDIARTLAASYPENEGWHLTLVPYRDVVDRRRRPGAVHPAWRRRRRAAHRLRQRRQPAARTRDGAQRRDGCSHRARCRPRPTRQAAAHGEPAARPRRRRRRTGARALSARRSPRRRRRHCCRGWPRWRSTASALAFTFAISLADEPRVRRGAGAACRAAESRGDDEVAREGVGHARRRVHARCARRRAGRAVVRAAHRRRAARAQPLAAAARRDRFRSVAPAHRRGLAAARLGTTSRAEIEQFWTQFLERVRAIPGVESAAATTLLPLRGGGDTYFYIEGQPPAIGRAEDERDRVDGHG